MNYKVVATTDFERELKRLAKKHFSLPMDLSQLIDDLEVNPQQGVYLGNNRYKIRLAISSKAKGKSGGARVITYVVLINETVYLVAIYDKSEQQSITDKEINERLKGLL